MKHDEPLSHAELLGAYWLDTPHYGPSPWGRTADRPSSSLRMATGGAVRAAVVGLAVVTILAAALSALTRG
ncbi:hypothetical protein QOM21_33905 [Streptomyces sp. Pv4-95]|uniref:hypothetical protein n=1 Tax=Streptomyces sp. Pv4-95 TaxID=3049543 RepID=UPI0038929BA6